MAKAREKTTQGSPGSVRIIAGQWRSRRIAVPAIAGVRPSGDRVRETLFNWLGPYIPGAKCLDLFAGSGVLAFEALSRGAGHATMLDSDSRVVKQLSQTAESLNHQTESNLPTTAQNTASSAVSIIQTDVISWLSRNPPQGFDIIFLDPPFNSDLLHKTLELIVPDWLTDNALVYVETAGAIDHQELPQGLEWTKRTQIGNVGFGLAARCAETTP